MKLVLANNHSQKFEAFYQQLKDQSSNEIEYAAYIDLLFFFQIPQKGHIRAYDINKKTWLHDYSGVYINGYLYSYELAVTVAEVCKYQNIPFVNQELAQAPSLSKLSGYAKLSAAGVKIPSTIAGSKKALTALNSVEDAGVIAFPAVLKRADADRGIDNFKVDSIEHVIDMLSSYEETSIWILQQYVPNNGFYQVSFYDSKPVYGIYRALESRPDGNTLKAHMYKPKGGINAKLLTLEDIDSRILSVCTNAMKAANRQIGSVDCICEPEIGEVQVLEVNYNPQLVTTTTFSDARKTAFINGVRSIE